MLGVVSSSLTNAGRRQDAGRDARDVRKRRDVADIESGGRLIEVEGGTFKPCYGSLLFTPPQIRHAEHNEAYFVYLVENVKHADPARVQVRVIHGEQLRKIVTDPGVQIQRYCVPLRRADYDDLPELKD